MTIFLLVPAALLALLAVPVAFSIRNARRGGSVSASKKALIINLCAFAVVCLVGVIVPFGGVASAQSATAAAGGSVSDGLGMLAAALSVGLCGIGGGYAVAKGSAAGIGALSENPKTFGLAMVFVVLGEGISLYGLLIAFLILNHVH